MAMSNATDRFMAVMFNRFDSAPLRDDYRRHGNSWARVQRDLASTATTSHYGRLLRSRRLEPRHAGNWNRRVGSRCYAAYEQAHDPVKPVVRFLRLRRMLDAREVKPLAKLFRLHRARQIAYGYDIFLTEARKAASKQAPLTPRQQRIQYLKLRQGNRLAA